LIKQKWFEEADRLLRTVQCKNVRYALFCAWDDIPPQDAYESFQERINGDIPCGVGDECWYRLHPECVDEWSGSLYISFLENVTVDDMYCDQCLKGGETVLFDQQLIAFEDEFLEWRRTKTE